MESLYPVNANQCRISDQFKTGNWLSGVMVAVLRQFFGSKERISLEKGTLLWNPDASQSQVQIDVVDNILHEEGNLFPKILVDLENQGFPKDSLGDGEIMSGDKLYRNHYVRTESAYSIQCWGEKKLQSWSIVDEVRFFIQTYSREIAKTYCMNYLRPIQVIKPTKVPLYDDYWVSRLIVEFSIAEEWMLSVDSLEASATSLGINQK